MDSRWSVDGWLVVIVLLEIGCYTFSTHQYLAFEMISNVQELETTGNEFVHPYTVNIENGKKYFVIRAPNIKTTWKSQISYSIGKLSDIQFMNASVLSIKMVILARPIKILI